MDEPVKKTRNNLPGAGPGRPKGVPNKLTTEVKQMVLDALSEVGGVSYLVEQAREKPVAFIGLVGKIIPLQVSGAGENGEHLISGGVQVTFVPAKNGD